MEMNNYCGQVKPAPAKITAPLVAYLINLKRIENRYEPARYS